MSELRNEFARYKSARAAMSWADEEEEADEEGHGAGEPTAATPDPSEPPLAPPGAEGEERHPDLLPDPPRAEVRWPLISVGDHLVETPDLFAGRMPAALAERAPTVTSTSTGAEVWVFEGAAHPSPARDALAGRRPGAAAHAERLDEVRRGCWEPSARVRDMDLAGVAVSVLFPSRVAGVSGALYAGATDPALGKACVRAVNDWVHDEWVTPHPDRLVAAGIVYLPDPDAAAAEVRRNAARGVRAVSFPENPQGMGLPGLRSGWWDPVLQACAETDTVVCLHSDPPDGPRPDDARSLVGSPGWSGAVDAVVEWLWSGALLRAPRLRLLMVGSGVGWLPGLLDRLDRLDADALAATEWPPSAPSPTEVLRRSLWCATVDEPSIWPVRERIGIDRIVVSVAYPEATGTWPDPQSLLGRRLAGLTEDEARRVTHGTAASLFGVSVTG